MAVIQMCSGLYLVMCNKKVAIPSRASEKYYGRSICYSYREYDNISPTMECIKSPNVQCYIVTASEHSVYVVSCFCIDRISRWVDYWYLWHVLLLAVDMMRNIFVLNVFMNVMYQKKCLYIVQNQFWNKIAMSVPVCFRMKQCRYISHT